MPGPRRNLTRHFDAELERLDREIAERQTERDRIVRAKQEYTQRAEPADRPVQRQVSREPQTRERHARAVTRKTAARAGAR